MHFDAGFKQARQNGLIPVLSAERLSGNADSGGYDTKEIANRLAAAFPQGKVLIVIREQKNMILSTYKEYVRMGGPARLVEYLHPLEYGKGRLPLFDFAYFEYQFLLSHYASLFAKDKLLVLPFELFVSEPGEFVRQILEFAGSSYSTNDLKSLPFKQMERRSLSAFATEAKRRLNFLFAEDRVNPAALFPNQEKDRKLRKKLDRLEHHAPSFLRRRFEERFRKIVADAVSDRYRSSNQMVQQMFNLDLARFGYDTTTE